MKSLEQLAAFIVRHIQKHKENHISRPIHKIRSYNEENTKQIHSETLK